MGVMINPYGEPRCGHLTDYELWVGVPLCWLDAVVRMLGDPDWPAKPGADEGTEQTLGHLGHEFSVNERRNTRA